MNFEDFSKKLDALTSVARNTWWIIGLLATGVGLIGVAQGVGKHFWYLIACAFVGLCFLAERAGHYWLRWCRFLKASRYIHRLTHDLRDAVTADNLAEIVCKECGQNKRGTLAQYQRDLLQKVLDNAAHAFREMTGEQRCMSSLLFVDEAGELYTGLYCSDADPERKNGTARQKGGLAHLVLRASDCKVYSDYEKERQRGVFEVSRPDWQRWYHSGIMAHFKVNGKPWGVLNIDSPKRGTFGPDHRELTCLFADACAMVIGLSETGHQGEHDGG